MDFGGGGMQLILSQDPMQWSADASAGQSPESLRDHCQKQGNSRPQFLCGPGTAWLLIVTAFLALQIFTPSCGRPVTPSTATLLTCPQLDLGNRNPGGGWDSHRVLAGTLGTDGFLLSLASMPARDPTRLAPSARGRGSAALCPQIPGRRNQCSWESLLSG